VYQIRRARKDFAVCIIFVSVLVLRPRNPKVLTKSKIEDEEENDEGASAHCSRSADLQSAVSRICNPRGVNSSTTTGRLGRCRLQIGVTAGFKPALRGRWRDAPERRGTLRHFMRSKGFARNLCARAGFAGKN
jgi:hypothetical protein